MDGRRGLAGSGMPQIKPKFDNFEDYLSYDDGTETLYELFNGE
jgi:hypothetical protein